MGGVEWTGGRSYLVNLFTALRSLEDSERPEIVLLGDGDPVKDHAGVRLNDDQVYFHEGQGRTLQEKLANRYHRHVGRAFEAETRVSRYYKKHNLDAVFALGELGVKFGIPLLGWIPDFQHVRMPEMFSKEECRRRDHSFHATGSYADKVVLSSQDAMRDFANFQPEQKHKGTVLSFVAQVSPDSYSIDPASVCARYHLPEKFFYLPNQLWKHKNHLLVIQALSLLKSRHSEITVVSSGQATDPRHPEHVSSLLLETSRQGVQSQMRFLGLLPSADIVPIMRQSLAVLQPSLFEGWSTTVEEAKSVGKSVLLSDTPIHREQLPPGGKYFDACSPEELANLLEESYYTLEAGPDTSMETVARQQLPARIQAYARCFLRIVRDVVHG